jgi:hypothetical protein
LNLWKNKEYFLNYVHNLTNSYEEDFLNTLNNYKNDENKNPNVFWK